MSPGSKRRELFSSERRTMSPSSKTWPVVASASAARDDARCRFAGRPVTAAWSLRADYGKSIDTVAGVVETGSSYQQRAKNYMQPLPGTTFPPRFRLRPIDLLKVAHSESDLTPCYCSTDDNVSGSGSGFGAGGDEDDLEDLKAGLLRRGLLAGSEGRAAGGRGELEQESDDDSSGDSDLFFDFDLSPEDRKAEGGSEASQKMAPGYCYATEETDPPEDEEKQGDEQVSARRRIGSGEVSSPTSSGAAAIDSVDIQHGAAAELNSPLVSPDSLLDEPVGNYLEGRQQDQPTVVEPEVETMGEAMKDVESSSDSSNDESEDADGEGRDGVKGGGGGTEGDSLTFYKGDCKYTVASSKLNSLVALLEKDSNSSKASRRENPFSNPPARSGFRSCLETIDASPVSTSFTYEKPRDDQAAATGRGGKSNKCGRSGPGRSDSLPALTQTERELLHSPQPPRRNQTRQQQVEGQQEDQGADSQDSESVLQQQKNEKKARLRRASSLKAPGVKSPNSPAKNVRYAMKHFMRRLLVLIEIVSSRFADIYGITLTEVKTFLDGVPKVPDSAYNDLAGFDANYFNRPVVASRPARAVSVTGVGTAAPPTSIAPPMQRSMSAHTVSVSSSFSLVPMFNQPGSFGNFFDLIRSRKICLENAYMPDRSTVRGTVRVQNLSFGKRVTIRYTTNEWLRSTDVGAAYVAGGSADGFSDQFSFKLSTAPLAVGNKIQFCLRYETLDHGGEYWDNNEGKNYVFQCLSIAKQPVTESSAAASVSASPTAGRSEPISMGRSGSGSGRYGHSVAQSPSVMSEDPWLQFY